MSPYETSNLQTSLPVPGRTPRSSIKHRVLDGLLSPRPGSIQVITRYNLSDFADGVSYIEALHLLLDAGAAVRGIRGLHAKLYMFGSTRAIVTSANLTEAGLESGQARWLSNNGIVSADGSALLDLKSVDVEEA